MFVSGLMAMAGLAYVWVWLDIQSLGDAIRNGEEKERQLQQKAETLQIRLAALESPSSLENKIIAYQLELVPPRKEQVIRLYEPGAEWDLPSQRAAPQTPQRMVAHR